VPTEVNEGVNKPIVETPAFPNQFPPEGLTLSVTGDALVQIGLTGVIVGVIVAVTDTANVLELGQTVGLGFDVVL
jgi:hypothetical protein